MAPAIRSMVLKFHTMAPSTAHTEPTTLAQPLAAQAQGMCFPPVAAMARIPSGNGTPIKNATGAINTTAINNRAACGNPINVSRIVGTTKVSATIAIGSQ